MKYININKEASDKLLKGVNTVANIVGATLGPCGSNVILRKPYNTPVIINDGVSIAREIVLEDPTENAGAELLTAAASNTNALVGDGTTTTCILTQSLLNQGFKAIEDGCNPIRLRERLKTVLQSNVLPTLNAFVEKANSDRKLKHVATISVGGNEEYGSLVASAFKKVGKDGVINIENNLYPKTELSVIEGYKIDRGYMTPYAINNTQKFIVDYEDCLVLCCYHKIRERKDVESLFRWAAESGKSILLIVEDIDESIFGGIQVNLMKRIFKICPVKSPGFGFNVRDYMNDIAKLTGCIVYADDTKRMSDFDTSDFGFAQRVIANREYTCIIKDPDLDSKELSEYVTSLKNQLENTENAHLRDSLKERISKLTVGVATISVGASTETEREELKLRIEDAVNATRAAIKGGVVPGAGSTFTALAETLEFGTESQEFADKEYREAFNMLINVFREIEKTLLRNSGIVPEEHPDRANDEGYNCKTKSWCNLIEEGIIDPALVVKSAIENSVSIASTLLTTHATIISEDKA